MSDVSVRERRMWVLRRVVRIYDIPYVRGMGQWVRAFHVRYFFALEAGAPDASVNVYARDLRWLAAQGLLERAPSEAAYRPTERGREVARGEQGTVAERLW